MAKRRVGRYSNEFRRMCVERMKQCDDIDPTKNRRGRGMTKVPMTTALEVESDVALKIQARARERGVSVDVYLRELLEQKETQFKKHNGLSAREQVRLLREWASGHRSNTPLLSHDAISRENIYRGRGARGSAQLNDGKKDKKPLTPRHGLEYIPANSTDYGEILHTNSKRFKP